LKIEGAFNWIGERVRRGAWRRVCKSRWEVSNKGALGERERERERERE
jgi:hypothetical protein